MARKKAESKKAETSSAPTAVVDLVARFREHADAYHAGRYNETQIRREFIDPFFKALGWDVWNEQGYAEAYKDVIHEDAISVGGATKAPDYCFRIGGVRKFFVEAKKPSVDIKADAGPAFQLRRYAWSAKLALSILTDFEELGVYDCRVKPVRSDKASTARVLYFRYEEYPQRWDELASVFSREAIFKGSFDKYAESSKRKRGTAEVDDAFLAEIEQWRDMLARNLALRNPNLTQRDLNFAVQRTIDRIVFLRICEDRGIEPYATLLALTNGDRVYERLFQRFRRADERYNSGLFHFTRERGRPEEPDALTPGLTIDDKPLKEVLARLYYPESPYEFSVLPADILGQVYEQFLGKVIRLTKGHRAVVEEKPEVRKAGGVYYTPTYIVDYIVKHTVGKVVEGKTPQQVGGLTDTFQPSKAKGIRPLTVLDPACGSGSFLLGAYQFLLDWYRDRYLEDGPKPHAAGKNPRLFQHPSGDWRLTTAERKRILLAHIHGVDIDSQAVETTKLSLLLKVLEGESAETIGSSLRLFHERALPDLAGNIKCGNSLIGPDFYDGQQLAMFDEEERLRINVFDWKAEFREIMRAGGFDAVIGNPPYVNAWELFAAQPHVRDYLSSKKVFQTADRHWDLFVVFLEQAFRLLRQNGRMAFIIPFSWAIQKYAISSRELFLRSSIIESIADFRTVRVFGRVPVITIIPSIVKCTAEENHETDVYRPADGSSTYACTGLIRSHTVRQAEMLVQHESMLRLDLSPAVSAMVTKMDALSFRLNDVCYINYGAQMSSKVKGRFGKNHVIREHRATEQCKRMISGRDLYRYQATWSGKYVDYGLADEMYGPRWSRFFESHKLMIRDITGTHRIEATLDRDGLYCDHTILCGVRKCDIAADRDFIEAEVANARHYDLRYLIGVVASRPLSAYYYFVLTGEGVRTGGGFHTYPHTIRRFPIPKVDLANDRQGARYDRMVSLVQTMLDLHRQLAAAKTAHAKTAIQRQIDATDRQIDQLVYELYGLTDDEIRIVEEATQ